MKKLLFALTILVFTPNLSRAFVPPCSFIVDSGSKEAYGNLDDFLKENNNKIKDYWENEVGRVIEEIKKQSKERENKLKILKNLEKERLFVNKEIEFLLKQESELLGNEASIESEVK